MPVGGGTITSFCRFVKSSVGIVVTSVQFVVVRSEFACNAKSLDGTIHERTRLVFARAMLSEGVGVDCKVQMPPP